MKKLILFIALFALVFTANAQDPNILIGLNDAYGIKIKANFPGQTTPWARGYYIVNQDNTNNLLGLGVMGSSNNGVSTMDFGWIGKDYNNVYMSFRPSGNVGVGTDNPKAKFVVSNENLQGIEMGYSSNISSNYIESIDRNTNSGMDMAYYISGNKSHRFYNNAIERVRITGDGNVLIGKTTQTNTAYKLDVNGKARANEIVVNTTGADFVFEDNYRLRPLAEVESFVKQNKHLPEIPTAKAMQQEGVGVSELQTKLLQKVEELTLYIIQQQKEIDELKKKLNK